MQAAGHGVRCRVILVGSSTSAGDRLVLGNDAGLGKAVVESL